MIRGIKRFIGRRYYFYKRRKNRYEAIKRYKKFDFSQLKSLKTSDTIFILGSGPSINKISKDQWSVIEQNDSFGVNSFLFHPSHVPTFYWYEFADRLMLDYYKFKALEEKNEQYGKVPFILNFNNFLRLKVHPDKLPKPLSENYQFVLPKKLLKTNDRIILNEYERVYKESLSGSVNFDSFLHIRGSIATCTLIALSLGYKNVVYPGVDLKNHDYFYDGFDDVNVKKHREYFNYLSDFDNWGLESGLHRNVDENISKRWGYPPMHILLKMIRDVFSQDTDVHFYSYDKDSFLAKEFEVYNFNH